MNTYKKFEELLTWADKTTYQVAKATGISTAAFSGWKQGKWNFKADKLQKIADYFGIKIEYFYQEEDADPNLFTGEYDNYKLVKEVGNPDDLGYFLDPKTLSYAEELRNNPELKAVFDVARDMPKEKLEAIYNVLKQME